MYILVVDDDKFSNELVQFVLNKEGYEIETTDDPRRAMEMIRKREPDLLLLDDVMPYMNGFTFAVKLREEGYEIPIIFFSVKDATEDKLLSFNIGADDYILKPFHHQDLVMRVQAVIRRLKKLKKDYHQSLRVGQIELFPAELRVVVGGQKEIMLTSTEMQVLRVLMSSSGQVIKRNQLLIDIWNDNESNSNIVDVYIRRLRLKLEADIDNPQRIVSVTGAGYKLIGE